ncbi:hypothetical protein Pstu01_35140 [Stutzerimonas stutzeri]|nr:hypothetical protein Pstu01_35140 [Stutzerimonas stutzeri]
MKKHPKLLVGGVWCIADLEYEFTEDKAVSPWVLSTLKPIQLSHFDFDGYVEARKQFTTDEWIDLLVQSIGFNPDMFGKRSKLTQLVRLIPFCERNYNLIELGPKGTGKSHIYSEFSPHGILISGGEVTVPKLFVNNSSGKIGLVGYWDCVAFDEFAGKQKRVDKALVDVMKNYMANKSFSRGVETLGAEVSVHLVTTEDEFKGEQQKENFEKMKESASSVGVNFTWELDSTGTIHARHIVTDHGWKISLDRGLDIFQRYELNDAFTFANRLQQYRPCKAFEVTFIKQKPNRAEG